MLKLCAVNERTPESSHVCRPSDPKPAQNAVPGNTHSHQLTEQPVAFAGKQAAYLSRRLEYALFRETPRCLTVAPPENDLCEGLSSSVLFQVFPLPKLTWLADVLHTLRFQNCLEGLIDVAENEMRGGMAALINLLSVPQFST